MGTHAHRYCIDSRMTSPNPKGISVFQPSILAAFLLVADAATANESSVAPTVAFKNGSSSSDWVNFKTYKASGIFFSAIVNHQNVVVFLYGGPTNIDRGFASSVRLSQALDSADSPSVSGVTIQVGGLTLRDLTAHATDAPAMFAKIVGQPVPLQLGEEVFKHLVVDIDSLNHRLAFRNPESFSPPVGMTELPLVEIGDEWSVPLSIDGAAPIQFELELGNVSGPLLVIPSYAQAQGLLAGHPTSQRLSGKFVEPVVSLERLSFAGVDFAQVPIALVPEEALPPAGVSGGVGWPLLSQFHLIIDYPHNRMYAHPNPAAARAPIIKDRLGLVVLRQGNDLAVTFVAHGSPAEAAGFKKGEIIAKFDGKPAARCRDLDIITLRFANVGARFAFTMKDGEVRRVKARDFF